MGRPLPEFEQFDWTDQDITKTVYYKGDPSHPPVVLMHELPGMVPQCVQLAKDLVDDGFCVFMPLLFGVPNAPPWGNITYLPLVCLSREFTLFAKGKSNPIASWLRSLCREARRRCQDRPIGVIGMCLTGNFALALMIDDSIAAPILSQPSLPIGLSKAAKSDLATSPEDLQRAIERSEREDIPVLGLRFTCDRLCPDDRFRVLQEKFGERFRKIELDSSKGNPHGLPWYSHSVLTIHRVREESHPTQQTYRKVVAFLRERLET